VKFAHFAGGGGVIDHASNVSIHASGFDESGADGLVVRDSAGITIGGTTAVSNHGDGVLVRRSTDVHFEGGKSISNDSNGVELDNSVACVVVGNAIQHNNGHGVLVTGESRDNELEFNDFGGNGGLAIDLGGDGPTANDDLDADDGPNRLQNAPVIDDAILNHDFLRIRGHLDSRPNTVYIVSTWLADPDPSGFGEGTQWLIVYGSQKVTTDANGRASFTYEIEDAPWRPLRGASVTALASRYISDYTPFGETSEFSRTVAVVEATPRFEVTTTADSGPGSLRAAIDDADAADCTPSFVCEIAFRIATPPNAEGVWRIAPRSPLPALTRSGIWLDGATQTEFAGDTNPVGPEIEINGEACGTCNGITVTSAGTDVSLTLVRDLIVNGFSGHGVVIRGSGNGQVSSIYVDGSYIGTDATGTRAVPNGGSGVFVENAHAAVGAAFDNRVRARGPAGCLISGNRGDGITASVTTPFGGGVDAYDNVISAMRGGWFPLPNGGNGITTSGFARIERNVIAFSKGAGVYATQAESTAAIRGNLIHSNGGKGIEIANASLRAPEITSARFEDGKTRVRFSLDQRRLEYPRGWWVELFSSSFTDASGRGEGRRLLATQLMDNADPSYELVVDENLTGKFVTMTATPWDGFAWIAVGTTSEFGLSVQVTAPGCEGGNTTLEEPVASNGLVTFRWAAVPGAIVYRVWTMQPGGAPAVAFEGPMPVATVALDPGTYEWWVETRLDCLGTQSEHRTVIVP
jgi:hypothetical protein